jgi:hypothetical protein
VLSSVRLSAGVGASGSVLIALENYHFWPEYPRPIADADATAAKRWARGK